MPDKQTIERARKDKREGKSASTQAGEFVHREIEQIRSGKHGAKNAKQAIAIGLSEARRAGVDIGENPNRKSSARSSRKPRKAAGTKSGGSRKSTGTRKSTSARKSAGGRKPAASRKASSRATRSSSTRRRTSGATSTTRARASLRALKKMPRRAASHLALSRQAHKTARTRTKAERSASARKGARTRAANRAGR